MIPILNGTNCALRGFSWADFADFSAMWAEPKVAEYIPFAPLTPQECWPRINRNLCCWVQRGYGQFCVADRDGRCCGIVGYFPNPIPKEESGGDVGIMAGWVLSERVHGQGIGKEAVGLAHQWLDENLPDVDVICGMHEDNLGSIRLAEHNDYQLLVQTVDEDGPGRLMVRKAKQV